MVHEKWHIVAPQDFKAGAPTAIQERTEVKSELRLATSRRNLRSEQMTSWVDAVLEGDAEKAKSIAKSMPSPPFAICRNAEDLRREIRRRTIGLQRAGILASSGAARLRAAGFEPPAFGYTRNVVRPVEWFLRDAPDIESSNMLEVALSEFETQGLELDITGVCWGGDLVMSATDMQWRVAKLRGSKWRPFSASDPEDAFTRNKYRVLLTRGRLFTVIMVPEGDSKDATQLTKEMDQTYTFLLSCGAPPV
jgi:hypothetical protein